ncbi:MAG: formyltransferase family protein [Acidobacteriota bacterium]|nr:formyltransferase family protein [Acidobacteriota bacterium]
MKVLLASSERFAGCMVESLLRAGHQVIGVVSPQRGIYHRQYDGPRFLLYSLRGWDMLKCCERRKIEHRVSKHLDEGSMRALIKARTPDLLVLFGWPGLVNEETLALFPSGGLNIHPSMLPLLRGADPLFTVIDSEAEGFGLTFHKVVQALDAGPVYLQLPLYREPNDSYDDLYFKVLEGIYRFLPEALRMMEYNPSGTEQQGEPTHVTRFQNRMRFFDPDEDLETLIRRTRACFSHHPRMSAVGPHLFTFSHAREIQAFHGRQPQHAAILGAGPTSIDIFFHDRCMRLGGIRFPGKPWWGTPLLIRLDLRVGRALEPAETVAQMAKSRGF